MESPTQIHTLIQEKKGRETPGPDLKIYLCWRTSPSNNYKKQKVGGCNSKHKRLGQTESGHSKW